jgi:hypothetical protein
MAISVSTNVNATRLHARRGAATYGDRKESVRDVIGLEF